MVLHAKSQAAKHRDIVELQNLWMDRAVQFYHEQDAKELSQKKRTPSNLQSDGGGVLAGHEGQHQATEIYTITLASGGQKSGEVQ